MSLALCLWRSFVLVPCFAAPRLACPVPVLFPCVFGLLGVSRGSLRVSLSTLQGIAGGVGFSSVMLFGVGWVVAFFCVVGGVWPWFFWF
jgi:hypothetical protein